MRVANLVLGILSGLIMLAGLIFPAAFLLGFGMISFFIGALGGDMVNEFTQWGTTIAFPVLLIALSNLAVIFLSGVAFAMGKKNIRAYIGLQIANFVCLVITIISEVIIADWLGIFRADPDMWYISDVYCLWPVIQVGILAAMIVLTVCFVKKQNSSYNMGPRTL